MRINKCPICGHAPIITMASLDKGNGRGYPNHFEYHIKCSNKECPLARILPMFSAEDIYNSKEEAYEYLCNAWNDESVKINELILHK